MSKVSITRSKLDGLTNAIASKSGTAAPLTLDQMQTAVGTLVKPVGTLQITQNGAGIDVAQYAAVDVSVSGGGGGTYQTKEHITPTESSQTITPDTGYDALSSVQIDAVSSTYVGTGVTRKAAATITPTKSSQTIASGTYLTGTQTIAAIPAAYQDVTQVNAAAGDVAAGKKIVAADGTVVTGTLAFQTIYSGSSAPSSSTGVNGDIYIQTA